MEPKDFDLNEVKIRPGQSTDIPSIHHLVGELAEFENAPQEFTATLEDYYRDFELDHFRFLVAEYNSQIIGTAIYYTTFSTWKGLMYYLEDFIVLEKFRSKGVGQKLFDAFLATARREGARLTKWQVLDWNDGALRFYERNNAMVEKDWWNCKIYFTS